MTLGSCHVYKQDILFSKDETIQLSTAVFEAERNYKILPNDWLKISVFPNKGEQLIDPNFEPLTQMQSGNLQMIQMRDQYQYLVQSDGTVKLPMIGDINVANQTIDEAEQIIEIAFNKFFNEAFVKLQFLNKRVVVLSQFGSNVIPVTNENISLLEVLAISGGLKFGDKANTIKIIRGDLSNPQIFLIDLNSVEGMKATAVNILPGDVIYIEPWRRPWIEGLRDISPVLGIITSVSTLVFIIANFAGN
jgi:polysaccharide export outer membrane protein